MIGCSRFRASVLFVRRVFIFRRIPLFVTMPCVRDTLSRFVLEPDVFSLHVAHHLLMSATALLYAFALTYIFQNRMRVSTPIASTPLEIRLDITRKLAGLVIQVPAKGMFDGFGRILPSDLHIGARCLKRRIDIGKRIQHLTENSQANIALGEEEFKPELSLLGG